MARWILDAGVQTVGGVDDEGVPSREPGLVVRERHDRAGR